MSARASLPKVQPQSTEQVEANVLHVRPALLFLQNVVGAQDGDGRCCAMGVAMVQASDMKGGAVFRHGEVDAAACDTGVTAGLVDKATHRTRCALAGCRNGDATVVPIDGLEVVADNVLAYDTKAVDSLGRA